MTPGARALSTRGERTLLAVLAVSPLVVFAAARVLGYMKFVQLGLAAVAAAAAATALVVRPRWGLYFILFYIYSGVGNLIPLNVAMPLTLLVAASVVLDLVRGDENRLRDALFWYACGFFALISVQSMLFARDPLLSLAELSNFAKALLVVWLIVQLTRTADQLRRLVYVVFAGAVATVGLGLVGLVYDIGPGQENYIGGVYILRFSGAHENPNRAAAFMCSALPLGVFAARTTGRPLLRILFSLGVITLIVGIFSTFSRSVIAPFVVVVLAVFLREVRHRRSYLALLALIAVGLLLTPRFYWERVLALKDAFTDAGTTGRDWSVYTRWMALTTAWQMFLDHPLTGVGLGNFIVASASRVFIRIVVHNTFLEVLVGTGVFGLATMLAAMGAGLRQAVAGARHRWRAHPEWVRSLCFYAALSGVSILISAQFGTMTFRYPLWVPVALGLVAGNLLARDRAAAAA